MRAPRELALALEAKLKVTAFEGRFFDKRKECKLTVKGAWDLYEPVGKATAKSFPTDRGRATCLLRHLGDRRVMGLTGKDVDDYRETRR